MASRGPRRLSWDHDDGFMKALSREDAIFMKAVPLTRRDGPDVFQRLEIEEKTTHGIVC